MVIIGARKRPVEPLAASDAQELSILRARTAAVIKKHCQLRQVEAHISRAMRVWVELDQGEKEPSLARIAALFSECLPKQYVAQLAQALMGHAQPAGPPVQTEAGQWQNAPGLCQIACAEEGHLEETAISLAGQLQVPESQASTLAMSEEQADCHEDLTKFPMPDGPTDCDQEQAMSEEQADCHEDLTMFPMPDGPTDCDQEQDVEKQALEFEAGHQVCEEPGIVISSDDENDEGQVQDGKHAENLQETCVPRMCRHLGRPVKRQVRRTSHTPSLPRKCLPHQGRPPSVARGPWPSRPCPADRGAGLAAHGPLPRPVADGRGP